MALLIGIVAFALVALLIVWWGVRGNVQPVRSMVEIRALMKPVDLQAFQNLVDPAQDMFLRRHLNSKDFRKVQRARRMAAVEYLWQLSQNAGVLIRAGQCATAAPDRQVASAGQNLVAVAAWTRVLALVALARVSVGVAFPRSMPQCESFVERYGTMSANYAQLGLLWRNEGHSPSALG